MPLYENVTQFHHFIGRVVDNNDPEQLGRVKIRVIGEQTGTLGANISDEDLPWAIPLSGIQSASLNHRKVSECEGCDVPSWVDAVGFSPTGIAVGSYVWGFYLDGAEKQHQVVLGTYHKNSKYPEPPSQAGSKFLQSEACEGTLHNDVAAIARGTQTLPKNPEQGSHVTEPKSAYKAEYPHNKTFTTKSGHAVEFDDTPGAERIHVYHKSGSYEEINKDGQWVRKIMGDDFEIVMHDKNVMVKGNLTIEVNGNVNVFADGEIYMESKTHIELKAPIIDFNKG